MKTRKWFIAGFAIWLCALIITVFIVCYFVDNYNARAKAYNAYEKSLNDLKPGDSFNTLKAKGDSLEILTVYEKLSLSQTFRITYKIPNSWFMNNEHLITTTFSGDVVEIRSK